MSGCPPWSRRRFCGAVAGGAAAVAASGSLAGCGNPVAAAPETFASVDDSPTSKTYGQIPIPYARFPDLSPVGGALTVMLNPVAGGPHPFLVPSAGILLVHKGPVGATDEFVATQSPCPHAGCPLGYSAQQQRIECPCHASQFLVAAEPSIPMSYAGQVMHKPAVVDLTVWKATVAGSYVLIDLNSLQGNSLPAVTNGQVVMPIANFPSLQNVGGSLTGQPPGLGDVLIVTRVDANTVIALSAVCTHQQCDVAWAPSAGDFQCPCHGSAFATDGTVKTGPAVTPLKKYTVTFDGTTITIQVG
jgi:cytochrome b6-f complex iron-sulfur subunit